MHLASCRFVIIFANRLTPSTRFQRKVVLSTISSTISLAVVFPFALAHLRMATDLGLPPPHSHLAHVLSQAWNACTRRCGRHLLTLLRCFLRHALVLISARSSLHKVCGDCGVAHTCFHFAAWPFPLSALDSKSFMDLQGEQDLCLSFFSSDVI